MYVWRDKREVEKWGGKGISGHFKQFMKLAWGKLGWANQDPRQGAMIGEWTKLQLDEKLFKT